MISSRKEKRNRTRTNLFEQTVEIDVNCISGIFVQENVLEVTISQAI